MFSGSIISSDSDIKSVGWIQIESDRVEEFLLRFCESVGDFPLEYCRKKWFVFVFDW
jgi:hypothetical protein